MQYEGYEPEIVEQSLENRQAIAGLERDLRTSWIFRGMADQMRKKGDSGGADKLDQVTDEYLDASIAEFLPGRSLN